MVGKWRKDVLSIIDDLAEGPQVTVFVKYHDNCCGL